MIIYMAVIAATILIVSLPALCRCGAELSSKETYVGTVTDTSVKRIGKKDTWLVFIEDGKGERHEFCNKDNWLAGKSDSSHVQNMLEKGHTYKFETGGIRFPLLSWYPNVLNVEEVELAE